MQSNCDLQGQLPLVPSEAFAFPDPNQLELKFESDGEDADREESVQ